MGRLVGALARVAIAATLFVGLALGGLHLNAAPLSPPVPLEGHCPLCGEAGVMLPEKEDLAHCECEKWWHGKNVSRIVVGDCSLRQCGEPGTDVEPELVYLDLPLYRCPVDGMLFTTPGPARGGAQ